MYYRIMEATRDTFSVSPDTAPSRADRSGNDEIRDENVISGNVIMGKTRVTT
jgi:hypothetical protein